jgi:FdhE protein
VTYVDLHEEWTALLERRPTFREPLRLYGPILAAWARWPEGRIAPLRWSVEECRDRWQRGVPLLPDASPAIPPEEVEELLAPVIDFLLTLDLENEALQRFAEAWDRGEVGPADLFPDRGRVGSASVQERVGLSQEFLAFLAYGSLRPILETYFAECRPHLTDSAWELGVCPFCGGPPGFTDLPESGRRRLACHLCGGAWTFSRLRCPYCGSRNAKDFVRLQAEDREEGYYISACRACNGYLKELDRRVRWNGGPALVEDWGTPHLDLVARREGYWRAVPTLIQVDKTT